MIGVGPHISTFQLAGWMPELWPTLCAIVRPRAAHADTSTAVDQKRSNFEAKTLCMALEGVESLMMEV